jgi:hypothetical protein
MRTLGHFTVPQIEMASGAKAGNIRKFMRKLAACGVIKKGRYVQCMGAEWRLVRELGPETPVQRAHGLYDPNSKTLLEPKPVAKPPVLQLAHQSTTNLTRRQYEQRYKRGYGFI